jgi:hypothetical protein
MKAVPTTPRDMAKVGPPFLHLMVEDEAIDVDRAITDAGDRLLVREIDALRTPDLRGLCRELGKGIQERPIADNAAALEDVMGDPEWVAGSRYPSATVYVVRNAENMLRDIPLGLATWGTMAARWAHIWSRPVQEGASWDRDPIPLHFIHVARRLPKDAPPMSRFELEVGR